MTGLLHGKVSLITNVSTRLSLAIANRLGSSGSKLFLTDSNENVLSDAVTDFQKIGIDTSGAIADLTQTEQRKRLFKEIEKSFGQLDVFACCPAENKVQGNIIDNSLEDFDKTYLQYLTTPFVLCKESVPLLKKSGEGSIILLTSIAGYTAFYDIGLYSSAQTGVLGLCKALAQSLAKQGIRVNSVATGMLTDDGTNGLWTQNDKCANYQLEPMIPLQRIGNSHDCAGLVEFLASDRSSYITGENLVVSGGINVRL